MRGPGSSAAAYRRSDDDILVEKSEYIPLGKRYRILGMPVIRGVVNLIEAMVIGIKALMRSAGFVEIETEKPAKLDLFLEKVFGDRLRDIAVYFALVLAVGFGVVLFMILPNLAASAIKLAGVDSHLLLNLFEGVIRLTIFFTYVILISRIKDIKRVFEYHGAEHKTIHAYENEEELTVENIRKYSTRHPRCGTAFLFLVIIISVIIFSFVGWHSIVMNVLFRLLLIPLVAGISFELHKLAGKKDNRLLKMISYPGVLLQKYTTQEPDDSQIEVAIAAMKSVLEDIRNSSGENS